MKKIDARTLTKETQEQLRRQAIRLRKQNKTYNEIGQIVGVNANTVWKWWTKYQRDGASSLKSGKRGKPTGVNRLLNVSQEEAIRKLIYDKTPDQLKLTFALWTRQAIKELIYLRFRIKIAIRTVGTYLKRWGFTPQKPLRRAYEQRPAAVQQWLKEEYPGIKDRAKQEGAEIHWGDEMGLRSDSQHGRGYSPRGKTPVIRLSAKRASINMISTVTNQGKVRFMIYQGSMNAQRLMKFLKQLIKNSDKKIFLVLDNLRVHHAKLVQEWLANHSDEIEVFYLPAYSPELNPDEYLNCDLKAGVHSKPPSRNVEMLKKRVQSHMMKLQKMPARVKKYFEHQKISYAA